MPEQPQVLVIGGGGTGCATAWDLMLRGYRVTLVDRGEFTSGTTGRHHGQLHSGARYAVNDRDIARECMQETIILRQIAQQSIERNWGLFVALNAADYAYQPTFLDACAAAGIPTRVIDAARTRQIEPALAPVLSAVLVPDGTIDAYRLPLQFLASAVSSYAADNADVRALLRTPAAQFPAVARAYHEVVAIDADARGIHSVEIKDRTGGTTYRCHPDVVVNAAGAWADRIAGLAGVALALTPAPGTMVAVKGRLVNNVVSRLRRPADGDILVPQRQLTIIGSTQRITDDPDAIATPAADVRRLLREAAQMLPEFARLPPHAVWSAARPLAGSAGGVTTEPTADAGRALSRDFQCIVHTEVGGLVTVIGGKATVLRLMAERVADCVDRLTRNRLHPNAGLTATLPLAHYRRRFGR